MTSVNKTYKVFVDKMGGGDGATEYIGRLGELFYDPESTTLRISNGVDAGGNIVNGAVSGPEIALGEDAGIEQGSHAVAIGYFAGNNGQAWSTVAIGNRAGK